MILTKDQLFAVMEGCHLTDENSEEVFDYQYQELEERSYKWSVYTTFVFFLDDKWYQGEYESSYEDGISYDDIECEEVQRTEVQTIRVVYTPVKKRND